MTIDEFNRALLKSEYSSKIPNNSTITCDGDYQLALAGYADGDSMWFALWPSNGGYQYRMYNWFGDEGCGAGDVLPKSLVEKMCPGGAPQPVDVSTSAGS